MTINGDELISQLKWRYAVKHFDPSKKISDADWATLEDALILTSSSYGMQPWKFLVIKDQAIREKLKVASWNQDQITSASHMVVFTHKKIITEGDIDAYIQRICEVRNKSADALSDYRNVMIGDLVKGPRNKVIDVWASRQTYIALGNLLTSAAMLGIDACPMEGFSPSKYDEILGLSEKNLAAVAVCTLGYRSAEDKYAGEKKVRFGKDAILEYY